MNENPYAPPVAGSVPDDVQRPALREIVLGWEKLRLWYNGVLLVPGLGVIAGWVQKGMPLFFALVMAVVVAVGANLCFLLGPAAELYLRGLFREGNRWGEVGC